MISLLIYYSLMIAFHFSAVSAQTFSFTQPATGPSSVCKGSNVTLQCVIVLNNPDNTITVQGSAWSRNINGILTTIPTIPNHRMVFNSTTGGFTDLVITNVTLEDDNTVYSCTATGATITSSVVLNVTGPPDDITDVSISPDACSFVVQWNNTSSDPVCGSVWYTVTISTEGGMLIITDNTTVTNYSVTGLDNITGLNNITVCNVNVTASNNVGSSGSAGMSHMINTGLPSSPPNITTVTPLNDTSFTVNWTISDPNYSYTVICTNLNTNVMTNFTVPENTNSYTVTGLITGLMTGLSDNDNYIVQVAAVNMCGNMISDSKPVTTSTLATSTTPSPTNVTDISNESSGNSTTTIIIIIVVVFVAVVLALTILTFTSILAWRHYHKESIKPNENDENHYAQPNGNAPQEKNNEEYAYAINGPRGVVFPTNSEMPQKQ